MTPTDPLLTIGTFRTKYIYLFIIYFKIYILRKHCFTIPILLYKNIYYSENCLYLIINKCLYIDHRECLPIML